MITYSSSSSVETKVEVVVFVLPCVSGLVDGVSLVEGVTPQLAIPKADKTNNNVVFFIIYNPFYSSNTGKKKSTRVLAVTGCIT